MQVLRISVLLFTAMFPFGNLLTVDIVKKGRVSDVSL